jgi:hypothetical protein
MMLGIWRLKVTAGIENIRSRPIFHDQPIQSANPVWTILLSGSPSSVIRFLTHKKYLCEVIDSSWVSIRFQFRVLRFYSTDGTSGRYYGTCLHNFFPASLHWCSCTWFCWLWLWHKFLPPFLSQFHTCACFITTFIAGLPGLK